MNGDIGEVVAGLKERRFYRRAAWPTRTHIELNGEVITYYHNGVEYTWTPSHLDLLETDWYECTPER